MVLRARSEAESGVREDSGLVANPSPIPSPVERIGALTASELAEVAPPQRGLRSGAFAKRSDGSSELDWQAFKLPPPPPAAGRVVPKVAAERAELRIADLSLQLANPFLGSSLLPPPPKKRPWLKPLLITVAGAALLAAGYAGALYQRGPERAAVVVTPTAPATEPPVIDDSTAEVTTSPAVVTAVVATPAAVATPVAEVAPAKPGAQPALETRAANPAASVDESPATVRAAKAKPRRAARGRARGAAKAVATEATVPASETSADEAPVAAPASAPKGLQQLTRAQVKTGLESVRPALTSCAAGAKGEMMAGVTISGAGRVTYATVEGAFAGTPQGSCMARALRGAQFPAFSSAQLRVRYPFVF